MTYLYIWVLVAMTGSGSSSKYEWQNAGQYQTPAACHAAATNLAIPSERHRCISRDDGGVR